MKFSQLPIGARFMWQGEYFIKTGPLAARTEQTGKQRIIPRSALLATEGETSPSSPPIRFAELLEEHLQACEMLLAWLNQQPDLGSQAALMERFSQSTTALRAANHQASR